MFDIRFATELKASITRPRAVALFRLSPWLRGEDNGEGFERRRQLRWDYPHPPPLPLQGEATQLSAGHSIRSMQHGKNPERRIGFSYFCG